MTKPNKKAYLGDGAYVQIGSYYGEAVLTTEDGISVQNRVVLGPHEIDMLQKWLSERAAELSTKENPWSPSDGPVFIFEARHNVRELALVSGLPNSGNRFLVSAIKAAVAKTRGERGVCDMAVTIWHGDVEVDLALFDQLHDRCRQSATNFRA